MALFCPFLNPISTTSSTTCSFETRSTAATVLEIGTAHGCVVDCHAATEEPSLSSSPAILAGLRRGYGWIPSRRELQYHLSRNGRWWAWRTAVTIWTRKRNVFDKRMV